MPAPLANSSSAWGKAVATTGFPAAMASTRTPEVTWSVESYGSTTTALDCDQRVQRMHVAVVVVEEDRVLDAQLAGLRHTGFAVLPPRRRPALWDGCGLRRGSAGAIGSSLQGRHGVEDPFDALCRAR